MSNYRRYYINRGEFANIYSLAYVEAGEPAPPAEEGWERITRKEAEELAEAEAWRREYDRSFSGYASHIITPYWFEGDPEWAIEDGPYYLQGRIMLPRV